MISVSDITYLITEDRKDFWSPQSLACLQDFTYGKPGYVRLYFTFNNNDRLSSVLRELIQDADVCKRITNIFEDDDTENYYVEYNENRIDDLIFIYVVNHLHHAPNWSCVGSRIYHIPVSEYVWTAVGRNDLTHVYKDDKHIDRLAIVSEWLRREGLPWDGKNMPYSHLYCQWDYRGYVGVLHKIVDQQLLKMTGESVVIFSNKQLAHYFPEAVERYDNMVRQLSIDGKLGTRWKNENLLYASVSMQYSDALYQNSPPWLGNQSFDIYIPSLRVAIEYQGHQHYKPVELFGGEDGFYNRIELDKAKRECCKRNDVCLIEWKYTRVIDEANLVDLYRMIDNHESGLLE